MHAEVEFWRPTKVDPNPWRSNHVMKHRTPCNAVYYTGSGLAEIREHRVDELERLVDLLSNFGAGKHNLAADED